MRSLFPMTLAMVLLLPASVRSADMVSDSTGWCRLHKGQVVAQTIETKKLPRSDTLIVQWSDTTQAAQKFGVTQNVLVMTEQRLLGGAWVVAVMPQEIYWYKMAWQHKIVWEPHGSKETVFSLPVAQVRAVKFQPRAGGIRPVSLDTPDATKPLYWPNRLPRYEARVDTSRVRSVATSTH